MTSSSNWDSWHSHVVMAAQLLLLSSSTSIWISTSKLFRISLSQTRWLLSSCPLLLIHSQGKSFILLLLFLREFKTILRTTPPPGAFLRVSLLGTSHSYLSSLCMLNPSHCPHLSSSASKTSLWSLKQGLLVFKPFNYIHSPCLWGEKIRESITTPTPWNLSCHANTILKLSWQMLTAPTNASSRKKIIIIICTLICYTSWLQRAMPFWCCTFLASLTASTFCPFQCLWLSSVTYFI